MVAVGADAVANEAFAGGPLTLEEWSEVTGHGDDSRGGLLPGQAADQQATVGRCCGEDLFVELQLDRSAEVADLGRSREGLERERDGGDTIRDRLAAYEFAAVDELVVSFNDALSPETVRRFAAEFIP